VVKTRSHLSSRTLLLCALLAFVLPQLDAQEIEWVRSALEAGVGENLDLRDVHGDSISVSGSTSENMKLIIATGATLEGGDGWRIKHSLSIGCEKQLRPGLSVIGFLDYARFDYQADQSLNPPFRADPSHTLSIVAALKAHIPWHVSPFLQVGLGISYVNRGKLYSHDPVHYPPTPETDHVNGGGSVLTYLTNLMVGVDIHVFKEISLFLDGGFNGDWQKDRYPANSLGRFGVEIAIH
jgi:hypothetical protein